MALNSPILPGFGAEISAPMCQVGKWSFGTIPDHSLGVPRTWRNIMRTVILSQAAQAQMRLHMEQDGIRVDDANREAYRELARAGIMYPVSTFARGPEAYFRFTPEGWDRRHEILGCAKEARDYDVLRLGK
jgi:hypothetical protein